MGFRVFRSGSSNDAPTTQEIVAKIVDAAPTTLDTLNELAAALGDDANFATTVTTSLGNKQDKVSGVSDTEIGYLDGVTSAIQTQINGKADIVYPVIDVNTNYAIQASDIYDTIRSTGSAITITINNVMTTNGQYINFAQYGSGQITFAAGSGVTLNSVDNKLKTNKQYSGASVMRVASGIYWLFGDLSA